jgi:hypothetical protein
MINMFRIALLSVVLIVAHENASASDLKINLQFGKHVFKVGEMMEFKIIYTNTSTHVIRFLPEAERYYARVLTIRQLNGNGSGIIIPFGELSMDYEGLSKGVVRLQPQETYTRPFSVQIARTLPPSYEDKRVGLFLWFRGSNIQLPGLGRYEVIAKYVCGANHPVRRYIFGRPSLWHGEVQSTPVVITFN